MKTIATMALLLGTIAVGIAPAAEARESRAHRHDTHKEWHAHKEWHGGKHFTPFQLHARQVKQVRRLAYKLERATDELNLGVAEFLKHVVGAVDDGERRRLDLVGSLAARLRRPAVEVHGSSCRGVKKIPRGCA